MHPKLEEVKHITNSIHTRSFLREEITRRCSPSTKRRLFTTTRFGLPKSFYPGEIGLSTRWSKHPSCPVGQKEPTGGQQCGADL